MKIIYRSHLKRRLIERKVSNIYPSKIYKEAEQVFYDIIANHYIAVKKLHYAGSFRNMVIAYDIIDERIEIITIHPISDSELRNKVRSRRWKHYEKT